MLKKAIQGLAIFLIFIFPLIYIRGFVFPGVFPRAILAFFLIESIFFLFLWYLFSHQEIIIKKSYITASLFLYIIVLFLSAILGADFLQSLWSSYFRMTGLITWLHYLSFLLVVTSVFNDREDWKHIFRAILLSGFVLALVSFLGRDGLHTSLFSAIREGGSLFGNTSYSGAYYLLIFFLSLIGFSLEWSKVWKGIYVFALLVIFFNPDLFNFAIFKGDVSLSQVAENPLILLGLARASTLVLWAGSLVLLFVFFLHKFVAKKLVVAVSFLTLVFISGLYVYGFASLIRHEGKIYDLYLEESGFARPLVWDIAVQGVKAHPILGYGLENFNYVYQEYFNPKIINIEQSTEWFDNVHNFTLAQILDVGIAGALILLAIFCLVTWQSFKLYIEKNKFYFLIIPFTLLFHFLQMQTFFQTDSALFLVFILLAFLISHERDVLYKIPERCGAFSPKILILILFVFTFYFCVYVQAKENLLASGIANTKDRNERFQLYRDLCCLKVYPSGALRLTSGSFMESTTSQMEAIQEAGLTNKVAEEYLIYLKAYEKYLPRHDNNYRYLVEYAHMTNTAFTFGIDELKKGEEIARKALQISESFPHAYWVLSVNLYFQGRQEEALAIAKIGLDLDPQIERSGKIYELIKMSPKSER